MCHVSDIDELLEQYPVKTQSKGVSRMRLLVVILVTFILTYGIVVIAPHMLVSPSLIHDVIVK